MTANTIRLASGGVATEAGWTRIDWDLKGLHSGDFRLSHAVPEGDRWLLGDARRGDHAVCAVLLKAMEQGGGLVVEGSVSPTLLAGLETLQAIWHRWRPNRYRPITILAEEESEPTPVNADRQAIFALSGGVDSSFSLFRHLRGHAGRHNYTPGAALFVHGMDIPLDSEGVCQRTAARLEQMLEGTGIRLIRMRTNSRHLSQDWEDSHGLQLAGCFLQLEAGFAKAIVASGEAYEDLLLPWGSTPLTDPLCSTGIMSIEQDGSGFDRTEKVAWLARHTDITSHLRVCWAGPALDQNCGKCEKCVRTMLNFWAAGLPISEAFPTKLTPKLVRSIKPRHESQRRELESLYRHSQHHHLRFDPIARSLRGVIRRATVKELLNCIASFRWHAT